STSCQRLSCPHTYHIHHKHSKLLLCCWNSVRQNPDPHMEMSPALPPSFSKLKVFRVLFLHWSLQLSQELLPII
uniref:Uncharacterized protein n=1 Tax=Nothoprocta perdicaria TaxID=30464 RepID=A0A8C7EHW0_NOTPE